MALPSHVDDGQKPDGVRALKKGDRVMVDIPANPPFTYNPLHEVATVLTRPRHSSTTVSLVNDKGRRYRVHRMRLTFIQSANAVKAMDAHDPREEHQQKGSK